MAVFAYRSGSVGFQGMNWVGRSRSCLGRVFRWVPRGPLVTGRLGIDGGINVDHENAHLKLFFTSINNCTEMCEQRQ